MSSAPFSPLSVCSSAWYGRRAGRELVSHELGDARALGRHPGPVRWGRSACQPPGVHPARQNDHAPPDSIVRGKRPGPPLFLQRLGHRMAGPDHLSCLHGREGSRTSAVRRGSIDLEGHRSSRCFVDRFPVWMGIVHPRDRQPSPSACVSADTASSRAMGCLQVCGQGWTESPLPTLNWGDGYRSWSPPKLWRDILSASDRTAPAAGDGDITTGFIHVGPSTLRGREKMHRRSEK